MMALIAVWVVTHLLLAGCAGLLWQRLRRCERVLAKTFGPRTDVIGNRPHPPFEKGEEQNPSRPSFEKGGEQNPSRPSFEKGGENLSRPSFEKGEERNLSRPSFEKEGGQRRGDLQGNPQSAGRLALMTVFYGQLRRHLDESLLASSDQRGWAALPVTLRESHDPYHTVDALLEYLSQELHHADVPRPVLQPSDPPAHEALIRSIKALYQLQVALRWADHSVQICLGHLITRLQQQPFMGEPIGTVEVIVPNQLINRQIMWPLTAGNRVRYPLGVVIRNPDRKVLLKAKVIC